MPASIGRASHNNVLGILTVAAAQRRPETNLDEKEITLRKIATKGGELRADCQRMLSLYVSGDTQVHRSATRSIALTPCCHTFCAVAVVKLFNAVAEAQHTLSGDTSGVTLREAKRAQEMSKDSTHHTARLVYQSLLMLHCRSETTETRDDNGASD